MTTDVRALRLGLNLSQGEFAERFGFNLGTLRHWEQGSRRPDRAASILLSIVSKHPDIVLDIIKSGEFEWSRREHRRDENCAAPRRALQDG